MGTSHHVFRFYRLAKELRFKWLTVWLFFLSRLFRKIDSLQDSFINFWIKDGFKLQSSDSDWDLICTSMKDGLYLVFHFSPIFVFNNFYMGLSTLNCYWMNWLDAQCHVWLDTIFTTLHHNHQLPIGQSSKILVSESSTPGTSVFGKFNKDETLRKRLRKASVVQPSVESDLVLTLKWHLKESVSDGSLKKEVFSIHSRECGSHLAEHKTGQDQS